MPALHWSVVFADLDPVIGSEQRGLRPVLVVSNEEFNQAMPNVTVLPLTSTKRQLYPAEALLRTGQAGLRQDSIVMAHQIRTISQQRLKNTLGLLDEHEARWAVLEAIKEHLDLD